MTTKTTDPRIPVGTRVRVVSREAYVGTYFGREGVVNRDDNSDIVPYRVVFDNDAHRALFDYDDLEVLTVTKPTPKFNVGDRVRLSPVAAPWRRAEVGDREGLIESFGSTGKPVVKWLPYGVPQANNPGLDEIELVSPVTAPAPDLRAIADEKRRTASTMRSQADDLKTQADALYRQADDLATEASVIGRAATIIEAAQ